MEETGEEISGQTLDVSAAAAEVSAAGVECDACDGRKRKAEQTCLECLASCCEPHLDLHNNRLHGGKRHKPVEATEKLQEITCPKHGKLLEVFCRTDQQCICYLCITNAHRTHDVISTEVVVAEKKIQLDKMQKRTSERIQTWEKAEEDLRHAIKTFKKSAEEAELKSDRLFTELICCMEKMQKVVKDLILAQKDAVVKEAEELVGKVQENIGALMGRDAELQNLKQLSQQHNHIQFLQSQSAYSISPLTKVIRPPALSVHPNCSFEPTTDAVSELIKKLNLFYQWSFITISERVKNTGIVSSPLPRTRQELLKYATKLTVDPDSVHDKIHLSEDDAVLTAVRESEIYFFHTKRFEKRQQALCKEGLRGSPRYWEVNCGNGGTWVSIGVSYKGIRRSGKHAPLFGRCKNSWALRKYGFSYYFWHDNKETSIKSSSLSPKIGVYLDHNAGVLAFYTVSKYTSLLYKVQTTFTEPVYAGFGLSGIGSQIQLCDLDSED
ncbi:tripartite motif-containing protein 16-like [Astyanax mexicanus]|uniref:Tripartite motif-containing protein 16-like n=1 Tax=Astyanax mexicanus TaxID=7994 RepID=A0A8T2LVE7_ASTMX|nr:tripartite motif-containing protein 16-like [Astyanax mexicanus]